LSAERWLTVTATWGYVILAFVGVWLSFSAKYLKKILANIALGRHLWWNRDDLARRAAVETDSLLGRPESPAKALAKIYKNGGGFRDFFEELCFNKELSGGYRASLFIFLLFLSVPVVSFIILSIFVARVKTTGPAILASEKCGLWRPARNIGDEEATRARMRDVMQETRAAAYAQNCYGELDIFDDAQCDFLYRREISIGPAQYHYNCPFENEICGQNQTVTFTTGLVDASELGTTTCTPLSMDYPFIQNETRDGITTYKYYYGAKPGLDPTTNYTFETSGNPFDRVPSYDVL
jgi:hypothetical protein